MLLLTHLSTRYAGGEVREEARAVFPAAEVARDFDTVEIPFPERGPARLVRWSNRPQRAADLRSAASESSRAGAEGPPPARAVRPR